MTTTRLFLISLTKPQAIKARGVIVLSASPKHRSNNANLALLLHYYWKPDRQSCQRQGRDGPGAHGRIEMTTASPPRLSISPVRFAFRCKITPNSFCSQRSPPLAVPIAKP